MDEQDMGPTPIEVVISELKWTCPGCGKNNVVPIDEYIAAPKNVNKVSFVAGSTYNAFCACGEEVGLNVPFNPYAAVIEESQAPGLAKAVEATDRRALDWDARHVVDTVGWALRKHRERMHAKIS